MGKRGYTNRCLTAAIWPVVERLEDRRLLSVVLADGIWTITGDEDPTSLDDRIVIDLVPGHADRVRATVNGNVVGTVAVEDVTSWVEVRGGEGNDIITTKLDTDQVEVDAYGEAGNDTLTGGNECNWFFGGEGIDSLNGGGGDDYLYGDEGNDTMDGGAGADELSGGDGDDLLIGGTGDDSIYGDGGNDTLRGGAGGDYLAGGDDDDLLEGGGGNDSLYAGYGDDDLEGGNGNDDLYGGDGEDDLSGDGGDDDLWGGDGSDWLGGDAGNDGMVGGAGDDQVAGGTGDDSLGGGSGNDTVAGGLGDDSVLGGKGQDQIDGGYGDDSLNGDGGRDTIWGGAGNDRLNGGQQNDTVYSEPGDKVKWDRWDIKLNEELVNPVKKVGDTTELKQWAIDLAVEQWKWSLGTGQSRWRSEGDYPRDQVFYGMYTNDGKVYFRRESCCGNVFTCYNCDVGGAANAIFSDSPSTSASYTVAPGDYSRTNTQVNGVDEADSVKTDGQYLYWIANNQLVIAAAVPADQTHIVSTVPLTGWSQQLYLDGDKVTVVSQQYRNNGLPQSDQTPYDDWDAAGPEWGDYGYYSYYSSYWTGVTQVQVIDVADRGNPQVVEQTEIDGWLSASREVDGRLYLVVNNSLNWPRPKLMKNGEPEVISQNTLRYYTEDQMQVIWGLIAQKMGYTSDQMTVLQDLSAGRLVSVADWPDIAQEMLDAPQQDAALADATTQPQWEPELYRYCDTYYGANLWLPEGMEGIPQPTEVVHRQWRQDYTYETEEQYRARLESLPLEQLLPGYRTVRMNADGQTTQTSGDLVDMDHLYAPTDPAKRTSSMSSVVVMNSNSSEPGPVDSTSVLGWSGSIYVSPHDIYLTTSDWQTPMGSWQGELRTNIYKFEFSGDTVDLEASGQVPGWVNNQFSMDEYNDYFRIATTSSQRDGTSNNVFVMKEHGDDLAITGGITGLAFSERIMSARFVGDRGYLVTYRQTDPLYTLDLSDPAAPTVAGALHVPGYSSYLHPVGRDYLLAIGRDGDANGVVNGVQVSLFNVADLANPTRVATYTVPTGDGNGWWNSGSWSQAEWDYHAFSYFPAQQVLALPVNRWEYKSVDGYWQWRNHSDVVVLSVDTAKGFTELGTVEHAQDWWGSQRNVRIGQYLYSINGDQVQVVQLMNPDQQVAEITVPPLPQDADDGLLFRTLAV